MNVQSRLFFVALLLDLTVIGAHGMHALLPDDQEILASLSMSAESSGDENSDHGLGSSLDNPWLAQVCNQDDSDPESSELSEVSDGQYVCKWGACGKSYAKPDDMYSHFEKQHFSKIKGKKKSLQCVWHIEKGKKCGFVSKQKGNLKTHIRTHTGQKPYTCPHGGCIKAFAQKGELNSHTRRHTGVKPYQCCHCGRKFAHLGGKGRHMEKCYKSQNNRTIKK